MQNRQNTRNRRTSRQRQRNSGRMLVNNYRNLNFDVNFASMLADLTKLFNRSNTPQQLRGIDVHGEGSWIVLGITKAERRALNPAARRFLDRVERNYLYTHFTYRWGQFNNYLALGPWTVSAGKCYGGNGTHRTIRFHQS